MAYTYYPNYGAYNPMYYQQPQQQNQQIQNGGLVSVRNITEAITDANMNDVLAVIDELMECVKAMMPKLYNATLERLRGL